MSLSTPVPFEKRISLKFPLVSASVEAGFPSHADDHLERGIDLNEELIRNPAATFLVRVKGESMRDAWIHPGDLLMIDRSVIHHLTLKGIAGLDLVNGSMSSNQSGDCNARSAHRNWPTDSQGLRSQRDIRKALIEADLMGCMVALHHGAYHERGEPPL